MYVIGYINYLNQVLKRHGWSSGGTGKAGLSSSIGTAGRNGRASWKRWRERRAVERELSALSDRTLRDIGLHRGIIEETAEKLVARQEARSAHRAGGETPDFAGVLKPAGCG